MYPLGHVALGYFAAKATSKITNEDINIPIIWLVSILPDIDFFIPGLEHRGPTHSIVIAFLFFLPLLTLLKRGYAYFAALASHSVIGDYFTAYGCKLFWPIKSTWIKAPHPLLLNGTTEIYLELSLFSLMIVLMVARKIKNMF